MQLAIQTGPGRCETWRPGHHTRSELRFAIRAEQLRIGKGNRSLNLICFCQDLFPKTMHNLCPTTPSRRVSR